MKTFKTYAIAALLAGTFALPFSGAHAEGYGKDKTNAPASDTISSEKFRTLDTDKSGSLSQSEFKASSLASADFDSVDSNSDGKLTISELQSLPAAPATPDTKPAPMTN